VLVGKKLYVYSTDADPTGGYTDCATADDATADDWPLHLVSHGHVITRRPNAEDSTDIKYHDALGRFIGVTTFDRFGPNATVGVYQSMDGITFEPVPFRGARVQEGAHNIGISGDESGHISASIPTFVAYAYAPNGSSWGDWPTFLDPITFISVPPGTAVGGGVSSNLPEPQSWSWSGPKLWDGDPGSVYSSNIHPDGNASERVFIDLGKPYPVKSLTVTPRAAGLAFPTAFTIQTGNDPGQLTDVPGQSYQGYATPSGDVVFTFAAPVQARYVGLAATALGVDDNGNHYLQIAELRAGL
jgi:hypothetical protein